MVLTIQDSDYLWYYLFNRTHTRAYNNSFYITGNLSHINRNTYNQIHTHEKAKNIRATYWELSLICIVFTYN